MAARYLEFAERFYCGPEGGTTREVANLRDALRPLLALYGSLPTRDLGIRQLKTLREQLIERGLARKTINDRMNRILRMFTWASEEELVPPALLPGLKALKPLLRGRSRVKEGRPVRPVDWDRVAAILPHLTTPVAGIVELMWHTGMRPGEACQLRIADLDTSGPVWFYRPRSHKTQHFGRERVIAIGPRGQEVLRPFLSCVPLPDPDLPLLNPRLAMAAVHSELRAQRKTKLWPSHRYAQASKRKAHPRKQPGLAYTPRSLLGAIRRACNTAEVAGWAPNQLRHAAASRIRKELGLEAARAVLGHSSAQVTEIYAELDRYLAARTMQQLG